MSQKNSLSLSKKGSTRVQCYQFCHAEPRSLPRDTGAHSSPPNSEILYEHTESLHAKGCNVEQFVGIRHDKDDCSLCTSANSMDDAFLDREQYIKEQKLIASLLPDKHQTICDLLTWLSSHQDWLRSANVTHYFRNHYKTISEAIDSVNQLPQNAIDHRITQISQADFYDEVDFPSYCSWPYMPYPYKSRVYYVPTRTPTDLTVRDYLKTMLGLPTDFITAITSVSMVSNIEKLSQQINRSLGYAPPASVDQRKRREKVLGAWSKETRTKSSTESDGESENEMGKSTDRIEPIPADKSASSSITNDLREQRARRLNKRSDLRAIFNVKNPRLLLVSEQGQVAMLQMRPDYIIKPHPNYINVFFIELNANAPAVYVEPKERW